MKTYAWAGYDASGKMIAEGEGDTREEMFAGLHAAIHAGAVRWMVWRHGNAVRRWSHPADWPKREPTHILQTRHEAAQRRRFSRSLEKP